MRKTKLFDPKLSVKSYSWKIGQTLKKVAINDLPGYDESVNVETLTFYNCRERSIALVLTSYHDVPKLGKRPVYIIVFGEHRNSDSIFIDHWTMEHNPFYGPTVADFPDFAYRNNRIYIGATTKNMFEVAADKVLELVSNWMTGKVKDITPTK